MFDIIEIVNQRKTFFCHQ